MNIKILGVALFALTTGAVAYYPTLTATHIVDPVDLVDPVDPIDVVVNANGQPVIDVVFVLDTTGSMSGLIQTAKEKIWSIASTMASAQPTPKIRIGLVGYRDRGDAYVTKVVELSEDLDSVYAQLMDFQADGGGDTAESVNAALYTAVNQMAWTEQDQAYQVIFLVGDAPPHMDYQDEVQYPEIISTARERGIVVNAVQCGDMPGTIAPWTQIAQLGSGNFFQVEQAGSAVAYSTPFDTELATLSARLDATRLYYGTEEERAEMDEKVAATEKLDALASETAKARRGVFNMSDAGRYNRLGKNELIDAVASGDVSLEEIEPERLPAVLAPMAPEEQKEYIEEVVTERAQIENRMRELAASRDEFISGRIAEDGGADDSLDQQLYETISRQAGEAGMEYSDGPAY